MRGGGFAREPLSFAAAVNRGIARARYSHICLLNNDMLLEPGFFAALVRAFDRVPGLFCATAQIRFPAGVRREETGKAVMAQAIPTISPSAATSPSPGEDLTWVLYGSGGCSLYDAAMLRALGGMDEAYAPAYVEDLDVGYRAWQRGWPTVFVAGAVVEHRHRATTSRYYTRGATRRNPGDQLSEVSGARGGPRSALPQAVEAGASGDCGAAGTALCGTRPGWLSPADRPSRGRIRKSEFLALTCGRCGGVSRRRPVASAAGDLRGPSGDARAGGAGIALRSGPGAAGK